MPEWLKEILVWANTAKTWLLPVITFVAGVLAKPLQEEVSRRIALTMMSKRQEEISTKKLPGTFAYS